VNGSTKNTAKRSNLGLASIRYFQWKSICNKLVVHPSYQHRGHGTSMLRLLQGLCDQDGVDQGVIPSHAGEPVYLSLGYERIGEMTVRTMVRSRVLLNES
jgi:N-acetylglutamate synthase-like GNAT family acetyltransferase